MDEKIQQQERPLLHIRTLGEFALFERQTDGSWQRIVHKLLQSRGPSLTMLKVLACQGLQIESDPFNRRHHAASRDVMIDAIWAEEADQIDTAGALRVAKSVANRTLRPFVKGEDVILNTEGSDGIGYCLNMRLIEIDADHFEQQVALASQMREHDDETQAVWETALHLYQGAFLPYDLYSDWAIGRREQISTKYRLALHQLAHIAIAHGRTIEAACSLHALLLAYPQDEDALCLLLPLLAQQQRYSESLALGAQTRRALQEEGSDLSEATLRLLKRVQQNRDAVLDSLPLVSAASERLLLRSAPLLSDRLPARLALPAAQGIVQTDTQWFDLKQAGMALLVEQWMGRATECGTLQAILSQEIAMFEHLKTHYLSETYTLSRRQALEALVALPTTLVAALQLSQINNALIERFLPHCAAGITSCWHLINDGEFATVQRALSSYLPHLETIVQQSDAYRATAAHLAAQAYYLAGLLAYHRGNLSEREACDRQSVTYAQEAGDPVLFVATQRSLAYALYILRRNVEALHLFQKSEEESQSLLPSLRSDVLIHLATAYGRTNHREEALRCINEARILFFETPSPDTPLYLSGSFGPSSLLLKEGITRLELGKHDPYSDNYEQAEKTFAGVEHLTDIPERFRVEILNHQAETALYLDQLEVFSAYLEQGIRGAQALGSHKRLQEAISLYKTVRQPTHKWRNENRIRDLGDLFIQ